MGSTSNMSGKTLHSILPITASLVVGAILVVGLRFIFVKPHRVHYHADFALYINGAQEKFDGPAYYEEVQGCWDENTPNPKERVHLHDNNNHVIHVHDDAVTWASLFTNLGFALSNTMVQTPQGVFVDGQDNKSLSFILNGKPAKSIANEVIKSEDALLISYGDESATTLADRYAAIPHDAHEFNLRNDPNTCTGDKAESVSDKLKRAIWK